MKYVFYEGNVCGNINHIRVITKLILNDEYNQSDK